MPNNQVFKLFALTGRKVTRDMLVIQNKVEQNKNIK